MHSENCFTSCFILFFLSWSLTHSTGCIIGAFIDLVMPPKPENKPQDPPSLQDQMHNLLQEQSATNHRIDAMAINMGPLIQPRTPKNQHPQF